ncbi:MAG: crossover junction endodeoxyribonuclease RuvC [Candidatus Adiutrix sp.]|nr:crossover junction endodeoxyribonuclease RuvC [Candidatus Adiutrix sp.]
MAGLKPQTLILGVDPGSQHTGYGLIQSAGAALTLVAQGRFSPPAAWPLPRRLAHIHHGLTELASGYQPQVVAVEDVFLGKNFRSALKLGQVRGVVLLAAAQAGAEVFEYAPRLVKNTVAGYGQAEKIQVARMVSELLNFHEPLAPDAADALAVAICHASQGRWASLLPGGRSGGGRGGGWRSMSESDLAALSYTGKV